MPDDEKGLFNIPQAQQYLNISRTSVYTQIKTGSLRPIKIGKRTLLTRAELDRFIGERSAAAAAAAAYEGFVVQGGDAA